jgi:hypothetical protein
VIRPTAAAANVRDEAVNGPDGSKFDFRSSSYGDAKDDWLIVLAIR